MTKEEYIKKVREIYEKLIKEPKYGFGYFQVRIELINAILDGDKIYPKTCKALKEEYRYFID